MINNPEKSTKSSATAIFCDHCGDDCGNDLIKTEDHNFCCNGCASVYELLASCNLGDYYKYRETPGIKVLKATDKEAFAFLENDDIVQKLAQFKSDNLVKVVLKLPAIHCASCIWLIENFKKLVPGVIESRVNFVKREALFTYDPKLLTMRKLVEQLDTVGYAPDLNFENSRVSEKKSHNRRLIFQMGVAGFCFGNIMLLSFPDYLSGGAEVATEYRKFFGYINFVLALPVLLFSAQDYLRSAWLAVVHWKINMDVPISMGILALFLRSSYEIFFEGGGGYMDSLAALLFFLLIGKWVQQKSYDSLSFERNYKSYFPISVQVVSDGVESPSPIEEVKKGDKYRVRSGELIPFDSILIEGDAAIDYSFVTGESDPVNLKVGDSIYAGGRQMGASVVLEAVKEVNQSYLTSLWNVDEDEAGRKDLSTFADIVGKRFTVVVILIAALAGTYWFFFDKSLMLNAISAVLIVACPCALALSFPFAFGNALRLMGRKGFYLKNSHALSRMSDVTDIVFDKTGTLTRKGDIDVNYHGEVLSDELRCVAKTLTGQSGHPLSRYVNEFIGNTESIEISEYKEVTGRGIKAIYQGQRFKLGSAEFVGVKVSAVSDLKSEVYFSRNDEVLGRFTIDKNYHDGLEGVLSSLKKDYRLYLVSGDNEGERQRMEQLFGKETPIYFNQLPHQKEVIVTSLQSEGKQVAMIGDGLNDANALRAAHFGVSVSDDVFRFSPASDAILTATNFSLIHQFFGFVNQIVGLVKWSFAISFLYNGVGMFFAVQGLLTPVIAAVLMPISSLTVVTFVTLGSRFLYARRFDLAPSKN